VNAVRADGAQAVPTWMPLVGSLRSVYDVSRIYPNKTDAPGRLAPGFRVSGVLPAGPARCLLGGSRVNLIP
jgi:hypothetical protein